MPADDRCIYPKEGAEVVLSKYWPDGTRFRRRFPNRTIAKKMRARIEEAIAMRTWRDLKRELYESPHDNNPTVAEFAETYLVEYCRKHNLRPDFKEETLRSAILPIVGHIRVKEFRRADAHHFEVVRGRTVKGATVNRGIAVLSNMLTFAMTKGLITQHPMVRYRRIPERRKALRVMTIEQERALVSAALDIDVAVGVYCGLMGETAMRPEEGLRQQWPFIDMGRRILTVDKSKTAEGEGRHIPLSDYALELLGMMPRIVGNPYVVVRLETMERVRDVRTSLGKAKKAVDLEWVTPRDFRHFRASQWVARGVDLRTVQGLLGHADIHTTMRYAHFAPDHAARSIIRSQRDEVAELGGTGQKQDSFG